MLIFCVWRWAHTCDDVAQGWGVRVQRGHKIRKGEFVAAYAGQVGPHPTLPFNRYTHACSEIITRHAMRKPFELEPSFSLLGGWCADLALQRQGPGEGGQGQGTPEQGRAQGYPIPIYCKTTVKAQYIYNMTRAVCVKKLHLFRVDPATGCNGVHACMPRFHCDSFWI